MDYHEWAPRSVEPPDLPPAGRPAERIDDLDDWSGPITGSGHAVTRYGEGGTPDHGYWDERYATRDVSDRAGYTTDGRPIPGSRQPDDEHTSTSWRTGSIPAVTPAAAPPYDTAYRTARPPTTHSTTTGSRATTNSPSTPTGPALGSFDDGDRDYVAALSWTAIWYGIPVLFYAIWAFTRSGAPKTICAGGRDCTSARSDAIHAILHNSVGVIFALLISLAIAWWIRRVSLSWRAISLGLAAGIAGAGIATLLLSAI